MNIATIRVVCVHFIAITLLTGCAPFSKIESHTNQLEDFEGHYSIYRYEIPGSYRDTVTGRSKEFIQHGRISRNVYSRLTKKNWPKVRDYDYEYYSSFYIEIRKKRECVLGVKLYENGKCIDSKEIKVRERKGNYLLKPKWNVGPIPYVFGELSMKRRRISLSEDNDLIIDSTGFTSGAFLLFVFLYWENDIDYDLYKRIIPNK